MNSDLNIIVTTINNELQRRFNINAQTFQVMSMINFKVANMISTGFTHLPFNSIITKYYNIINAIYNKLSKKKYHILFIIWCMSIYKYNKKISSYYNLYIKSRYKQMIKPKEETSIVTTVDNIEEIQIVEKKKEIYLSIDVSDIKETIVNIIKYIQLNPNMFNTNVSYKLVNYIDNEYTPVYNEQVEFNDTNFNVHGNIITEYSESVKDKVLIKKYNIKINLYKEEENKESYIDYINKFVVRQIKYGNVVNLKYYKVLSENLITYNFYNEDILKWQKDIQFIENGYFSEHKDYLFSIMKQKMEYNIENNNWNNLLLHGPVGCHAIDTPILMYDGIFKLVQDIKIGEVLMGDDSTPRKVLSLCRNKDMMYKITNVQNQSYTVNKDHILCLKYSTKKKIRDRKDRKSFQLLWFNNNKIKVESFTYSYKNDNKSDVFIKAQKHLNKIKEELIIEIPVIEYLKLSTSYKKLLKEYKVKVDFKESKLPLDPYMVGYWLGDGTSSNSEITTQESSVVHYFKTNLEQYKCHLQFYSDFRYRINGNINTREGRNHVLNVLKQYNLLNNKHIPHIYKCNSRENRLKLLAGILDADGSYSTGGFEFSQSIKHEQIIDDVIYLCRSLGFACYKNKKKTSWTHKGIKKYGEAWRICINGEGVEEIPTLCPRKKAGKRQQMKDVLVSGIKVEKMEEDNYYGFELDGNHRYIMNNFVVSHNSGKSNFIYRVATLLKKSIISIDLNLYIDKKQDLYSLFHSQEFNLPNNNNKQTINKNSIIILEEFDNCIKRLVDLEKLHQFKSNAIRQSFDSKKNAISIKNNEKDTDHTDSYGSISSNSKSHREFSNKLSMINLDIDTSIKAMNESSKSDILRLSDLLELFQGPIPIKDRLIIATTNHFEEIKNTLPALFRPGRLTPIHFPYLDWKSFNELCYYYFKQRTNIDPFIIHLPTSQLTEIAVKHSVKSTNFDMFLQDIIQLNDIKIKEINDIIKAKEDREQERKEYEEQIRKDIEEQEQKNIEEHKKYIELKEQEKKEDIKEKEEQLIALKNDSQNEREKIKEYLKTDYNVEDEPIKKMEKHRDEIEKSSYTSAYKSALGKCAKYKEPATAGDLQLLLENNLSLKKVNSDTTNMENYLKDQMDSEIKVDVNKYVEKYVPNDNNNNNLAKKVISIYEDKKESLQKREKVNTNLIDRIVERNKNNDSDEIFNLITHTKALNDIDNKANDSMIKHYEKNDVKTEQLIENAKSISIKT